MYSVVTRVSSKQLTTLQTVKDDLDITGTTEDVYLGRLIDRASAAICTYLNVPKAADGSSTILKETLAQSFWRSPWYRADRSSDLVLARLPVTAVASIVVGDTTIDPGDYELDGADGVIRRLPFTFNSSFSWQPNAKTVVTFDAGWVMAADDSRTLPFDIEEQAIALVKSARAAKTRDPLLRSIETAGVDSVQYWVGSVGDDSLPPDIAARLDDYRYEPIG
jgi:hypothetical protein